MRITCPKCRNTFVVDDSQRGQRVQCDGCKLFLRLPDAPPKAPAPPPLPQRERVQTTRPRPPADLITEAVKDDDQDDRPRRKKRKQVAQATNWMPIVVGGILIGVVLVGGAAAAVVGLLVNRGSDPVVKSPAPVAELPKEAPKKEPESKPPPKKKQADDDDALAARGGQLAPSVIAKVKAATVHVRATMREGVSQGSGFFAIESGLAVTNAHVLGMKAAGAPPPSKVELTLNSGEADARTVVAEVVGYDRDVDLALLRVKDSNLPAPLKVVPSAGLQLTQPVYIFGFPLGEELGKNVTVSQTQVSSLRNAPDGKLAQVQVGSGMHPGNSGGPLVNYRGDVVGIAVSGIKGTQINFAVPCEACSQLIHGRIANIGMGHSFTEGAGAKVRFQVDVLDPLRRAKKLTLASWVGKADAARGPSGAEAAQAAGDSPRDKIELPVKGGLCPVDLAMPSLAPGQVLWLQAVLVDGANRQFWSPAIPFKPHAPFTPEPAHLALKTMWGARVLLVNSTDSVVINDIGKPEKKYDVNMITRLNETTASQKGDETLLYLQYRRYEVGMPTKMMTPDMSKRMQTVVPHIGKMKAILVVDSTNRLLENRVDVSEVPQASRFEMTDLHGQIQDSLEMMSLPLPGRLVQAGEQWRAPRQIYLFSGERGDLAPMQLTYTYLGTQMRKGRKEAVIAMEGVATGNLGGRLKVYGRVTGSAFFDMAASQIAQAEVTGKMDMEMEGRGKMTDSLVSKLERSLGDEVLSFRGQLDLQSNADKDKRFYKRLDVQLEEGKVYFISVNGQPGQKLLPRVKLIDPFLNNWTMTKNAEGSNTDLLEYTATKTGAYSIIVTTQFPGLMGDYQLVVRKQ